MAKLGLPGEDPEPAVGVFFGGSTAGMAEAEEFFRRIKGVGSGRPSLALLAAHQLNAPGDAVARHLKVSGPVESFSSACASGGLAVGAALESLRTGEVEIALAGGSDSLCQLTYAGFNSLRAVAETPCRPFRGDREGLSLGEGAGVLVLERLAHARRRGVRPLAVLLGAGATCDAHHMTAPHPRGEGAARAINAALKDAAVGADEVSFVNAHGTGTLHNDAAEHEALKEVFGDRIGEIPVTSSKGSVGHLLGSSGAIEAVATVLCLTQGAVHPTPGGGPVDPKLGVHLVLERPWTLEEPAIAISTSLAFGGANAVVVLAGIDHPSIVALGGRV
jgi:3-oxoacyl-(acyl-carrier-protein) synthase